MMQTWLRCCRRRGKKAPPTVDPLKVAVSDFGTGPDAILAANAAVQPGGTLCIDGGTFLLAESLIMSVPAGGMCVEFQDGAELIADGPGIYGMRFEGTLADPIVGDLKIDDFCFRDPDPAAHVGLEETHGLYIGHHAGDVVINNIKVDAAGDEGLVVAQSVNVTVNGGIITCAAAQDTNGAGVNINASQNVTINDVIVNDTKLGGDAISIEITSPDMGADTVSMVLIDGVEINGSSGNGISIIPGRGEVDGVQINNVTMDDVALAAVLLQEFNSGDIRNVDIDNLTVTNSGYNAAQGAGVHRGAVQSTGLPVNAEPNIVDITLTNSNIEWGAAGYPRHHGFFGRNVEDSSGSGNTFTVPGQDYFIAGADINNNFV